MFTTEKFSDLIERAVSEIPYPSEPRGLYEPIKYTLEGGGKRLRPVLLLATCEALGSDMTNAMNQAIGIELFHNFTLLHDDVMDNADMRRGRPTVHKRWNTSTAILSGDAMLTMASRYMGDCDKDVLPEVLALFNKTAMEIYEGQQFDMDFEDRKGAVTVEEYLMMIRLKTSVLLACACRLGAIMAGADETSQQAMYRYGELLGLSFQLQDDYLDSFGDPALFGKEIGGDIINEKKTWLWINAMNRKPDEMRSVLDKKLTDYLKINEIKAIYEELDLPSETHELINRYVNEAIAELSKAKLKPEGYEFFKELALKTTNRTY